MQLEIWTIDKVYRTYDLDEWALAYEDNGPFGGEAAIALGNRKDRRVDVYPWSSIVKISYPNVDELRAKLE